MSRWALPWLTARSTGNLLRARGITTYIVFKNKDYEWDVGNMSHLVETVLVEYMFPGLPSAAARDLPRRVEAAIHSLVARERLPSDEDVRAIVRGVADQEARIEDPFESEDQSPSVQVMLPHEIAVDLAMHRSFHTVQPREVEPLTLAELRALTHRSRRTRLRVARHRMTGGRSSRRPPENCVVCLEPVRCLANRIVLECKHEFHRGCITVWLNTQRACPSCRYEIDLSPRMDELHFLSAIHTRSGGNLTMDEDTESELEEETFINL